MREIRKGKKRRDESVVPDPRWSSGFSVFYRSYQGQRRDYFSSLFRRDLLDREAKKGVPNVLFLVLVTTIGKNTKSDK